MNHANLSFIVLILARGGTAFFHLKLIQHLCFYFARVPLPLAPGPLTPLLADWLKKNKTTLHLPHTPLPLLCLIWWKTFQGVLGDPSYNFFSYLVKQNSCFKIIVTALEHQKQVPILLKSPIMIFRSVWRSVILFPVLNLSLKAAS